MYSEDLLTGEDGIVQQPLGYLECNVCHRYFGDASIRLHEKHCEAKRLREAEEKEAETRHRNRVIRQMPGVLCYICGKPFGRAGMVFHEPQCLAKWRRINAELPRKERRTEPKRPAYFMRPGMYTNRDVLNIVNGPVQPLNVNNNPPPPRLVTPTPKPRTDKRVMRKKIRGSSASPSVYVSNVSESSGRTTSNASPVVHPRRNGSNGYQSSRSTTSNASSVVHTRENGSSGYQSSRSTTSNNVPSVVHPRENVQNDSQASQANACDASKWLAPSM